jgi:hypothetical protein
MRFAGQIFFLIMPEIGAFPECFAPTIAGAAAAWQTGVWPNIAPAGNSRIKYLSTNTDPKFSMVSAAMPCSRRHPASAN